MTFNDGLSSCFNDFLRDTEALNMMQEDLMLVRVKEPGNFDPRSSGEMLNNSFLLS